MPARVAPRKELFRWSKDEACRPPRNEAESERGAEVVDGRDVVSQGSEVDEGGLGGGG